MDDDPANGRSGWTGGGAPLSRRRVLAAGAAIGIAGAASSLVGARQSQEFELVGRVSGWEGVSPSGIEGETNPTLDLVAGQDYTLTWENGDGAPHDFRIETGDGEDVVTSDEAAEQGETVTVEFTASQEMAEYYCGYHPQSMRGQTNVSEAETPTPTETETETETPEETPEETPTVEEGEYTAALSGENEVPPVDTDASGEAHFTVEQHEEGPDVHYELTVSGPWNGCVTQAHIHVGGPDENGPVVAFLFEADEPVVGAEGTLAEGSFTAEDLLGPLEGEDLGALVDEMDAGTAYVNVHSTEHPPGEIRGQIEPADGG